MSKPSSSSPWLLKPISSPWLAVLEICKGKTLDELPPIHVKIEDAQAWLDVVTGASHAATNPLIRRELQYLLQKFSVAGMAGKYWKSQRDAARPSLHTALELTLMYLEGDWTIFKQRRWEHLTGVREASVSALLDFVRKTLEYTEKTDDGNER